jgi:hypothetical protein
MRINALVASIDVRSGNKNGKPWKMATCLLVEKVPAKDRPRLKTPLTLRLGDDDMDIADRAAEYEDTVMSFDITEIGYDEYNSQVEARGAVVRAAEAPSSSPSTAAAKSSVGAGK